MSKKGGPAAMGKVAAPENKQREKVQRIKKMLPAVSEEAIVKALTDSKWNPDAAVRVLKQTDPDEWVWNTKSVTKKPTAEHNKTPPRDRPRDRTPPRDRAPRGAGGAAARGGAADDHAGSYELSLQIPPHRYGVVVGTQGRTMTKINQDYNVKCHVPGRGETGPVTVRGKKEDCERAQKKLQEILGSEIQVMRRSTAPVAEKTGAKLAGGKVIQKAPRRAGDTAFGSGVTATWREVLTSGAEAAARTPPPESAYEEEAQEGAVTPPASAKAHMRHSPSDHAAASPAAAAEARPIREKPAGNQQAPQGRDVHVTVPATGTRVSVQLKEGKQWIGATVLGKGQGHDQILVRADGMGFDVTLPHHRVRPAEGGSWGESSRDAPSPPPPEHEPTEAEKLREVFDSMDSTRRGTVTYIEFSSAFDLARVQQVGSETIQKLFEKLTGDDSSDNVPFANFRKIMPEHYPLLLDALYWRPREVGNESRPRDAAGQTRRHHERLQSEEAAVRKRVEDAIAEVRTQETRVRQQDVIIEDSVRRETEVTSQLQQLDDTYNHNQEAVDHRKQEQRAALEREKLARISQKQAEQSCEEHQRRLRLQEEQTKRAVDKLNELKRQVAEQQKDVDRLQSLDDEVAERLGLERHKVQTAIHDAENAKMTAESAKDGLLHAEREMQKVVGRRKEQEESLKRAKDDTERQRRQAMHEHAELEKRRQAENSVGDEFARVSAQKSEMASRLRELEEHELQRQKEQIEDEKEDNDKIVKQIKLRAMQDELDAESAALHGARIRRRQA